MKINKLTITGADDNVPASALELMQKIYPFVEWGILFGSKQGHQRFPSADKMKEFTNHIIAPLNLSAHFCGAWSRSVLEKQEFHLISDLDPAFKRVQLNYNFGKNTGWDLNALLKYARQTTREIIFQYNKDNADSLTWFMNNELPENIHFLWDDSGGYGKAIDKIQRPFAQYTGYAGGIRLDNISRVCKTIQNSVFGNGECWIDLETGARTNNEFDMMLVRKLLHKASQYIK